MALKVPPLKAPPALVADWIELRTLADAANSFRLAVLKRHWDVSRDRERSDPEGRATREEDTDDEGVSGADADAYLEALTEELAQRKGALRTSYPFDLADNGLTIKVANDLNIGQYVYLFCLIVSNYKEDEILEGTWIPRVNNRVRDLFQACSTIAAADYVQGCSISFGWPRPEDNPPFLEKIKEVYALMGEGVPVDQPRPGASVAVKDEEIDIIAWRPQPDRAAGTQYLLGQVASGDNWEVKSIKGGPIDYFHRTWFTQQPPSEANASIFIPHAVTPGAGGGTRADRLALQTAKFGIIFDRLRLPSLTEKGLLLAHANAGFRIERQADLPKVCAWVTEEIERLKGVGAVAL